MLASDKQVTATVRGRPKYYATLRTAVLHHNQLRDQRGSGASAWPSWIIDCEGETYHISYNGRVWCGLPQDWTPLTREVVFP